MTITGKEYNQIIKELSQRWIDLIYNNSRNKLRKKLPKKDVEHMIKGKGTVEIISEYRFIVGDLQQILGRIRRKNNHILK